MGELVSITVAAERLTAAGDAVDRSTLSRYLKQHAKALPLQADGKANLVDYDLLAAHWTPGRPMARFAGSQSDGVARKVQAEAEIKEMDLALRRKQLTPVAEVDRGARDAIALMQSAFDRAIDAEATLSIKYGWDERTVRIALKAFARHGLEVFHGEILKMMDVLRRGEETGEPAETQSTLSLQ